MVMLTPGAAEQVRHSMGVSGSQGLPLRIEVRSAGEGRGLVYRLGFDESGAEDSTVESEGITLLLDQESLPLVEHLLIDFVEDATSPEGGEFVFLNPLDHAEGSPPTSDG